MDDQNPYLATTTRAGPVESSPTTLRPERPWQVALLAVLHGLGGLFLLARQLAIVADPSGQDQRVGAVLPLADLIISCLGLLLILSSAGMWRGARWGWWLGAFYHAQSLCSLALLAVLLRNHLTWTSPVFTRTLLNLLILGYLFRAPVLHFFRIPQTSRLWMGLVLVAICVLKEVVESTLVILFT